MAPDTNGRYRQLNLREKISLSVQNHNTDMGNMGLFNTCVKTYRKKPRITEIRTCAQSTQISKPYKKFAEYRNTSTVGK